MRYVNGAAAGLLWSLHMTWARFRAMISYTYLMMGTSSNKAIDIVWQARTRNAFSAIPFGLPQSPWLPSWILAWIQCGVCRRVMNLVATNAPLPGRGHP